MIVRKKNISSNNRKKVCGGGFIDNLRGIGSYIFDNKDLIAKPMLSAVGNVGAYALTEGSKAIINKLKDKNNKQTTTQLSSKSQKILDELLHVQPVPISNILGSGIKKF